VRCRRPSNGVVVPPLSPLRRLRRSRIRSGNPIRRPPPAIQWRDVRPTSRAPQFFEWAASNGKGLTDKAENLPARSRWRSSAIECVRPIPVRPAHQCEVARGQYSSRAGADRGLKQLRLAAAERPRPDRAAPCHVRIKEAWCTAGRGVTSTRGGSMRSTTRP